jgi:hypothetical protein
MWTTPTQMTEDVWVRASRFFQRVGKDSKAFRIEGARRHNPLLVGSLGEPLPGPGVPRNQWRCEGR